MPVVVKPHAAVRLEREERSQKGTDQGDEATEDRDTTGDEIGDDSAAGGAAQPGDPVGDAV